MNSNWLALQEGLSGTKRVWFGCLRECRLLLECFAMLKLVEVNLRWKFHKFDSYLRTKKFRKPKWKSLLYSLLCFCQKQLSNLSASAVLMTSTAWLSSCHGNAVKERLYRSRGVSLVKPMTQDCSVTFKRLRHPLLLPSFCMLISRNKSHFTLFYLHWIIRQVILLCSVCKTKACGSQLHE